MYAKISNNVVVAYPYSVGKLKADNPNTSFPKAPSNALLEEFGVYLVFSSVAPTPLVSQVVEQGTPVYDQSAQRWVQVWTVRDKTAAELQADLASLQATIVSQVQTRLDTFAQSRNYDGILSACTYAVSAIPSFQAEGQYCVQVRDATWAELYTILAEALAGTRPIPAGYADIETELPALVWPN